MPHEKIRAHYEYMSVFQKGRLIKLKTCWTNRTTARHMGQSDVAITVLERMHQQRKISASEQQR